MATPAVTCAYMIVDEVLESDEEEDGLIEAVGMYSVLVIYYMR